jgi:serine/threonine protein kinase
VANSSDLLGGLPSDEWNELEKILEEFEGAWRRGERPTLDQALRGAGRGTDSFRRQLLIELVSIDLEYRLKGGEEARLEEYLERHPELRANAKVVLELIEQEFALRRERDPDVSAGEYFRRFPRYRRQLKGILLQGERRNAPALEALGLGLPSRRRYELLGELGRGGMGVVYRARAVGGGQVIALKMIRADVLDQPLYLERFRKEIEAVAKLEHPNIVRVSEYGHFCGRPFFVLELVEGGNLAKQIAGRPQPPGFAAGLVETLARAMEYAHQRGVLHRDLKPENILLTADGTPKISDFGLAKLLDEDAEPTISGLILGSPCYMAPEQAFARRQEVGFPTDVYGLGAILYELLTGRPPFRGATRWETLDLVRNKEPAPPSRLQPGCPSELEAICLKCLEKEPPRRYAGAAPLAEDLRRYLQGEPISLKENPEWERLVKWGKRVGFEVLEQVSGDEREGLYKARQELVRRLVLLKLTAAGRDAAPGLPDRFRREAEFGGQLAHPNILQVYTAGTQDGTSSEVGPSNGGRPVRLW